MLQNLCISLAMRLAAPGISLYEAECLAAVIVLQVILLFAASGIRFHLSGDGILPGAPRYYPFRTGSLDAAGRSICGIFPGRAGTAAGLPRSLHTH